MMENSVFKKYDWRMENEQEYSLRISFDNALLNEFEKFCRVDLQLAERTTRDHVRQMRRFFKTVGGRELTKQTVREYLLRFTGKSESTYANVLKSLKVFFRDFLGERWIVEGFRFPYRPIKPKIVPTREEIKRFYSFLSLRDKALFLMFATTGLRRSEVLSLMKEDVNLERREVKSRKQSSRTKNVSISFFNEEAKELLKEYLASRKDGNPKLFKISSRTLERSWKKAYEKSGVKIMPRF